MRHIATSILLLTALSGATAQNLSDAYQSGTVVFQEDAKYGAGTDWKDVFSIPTVQDDGSAVEPRKSLAVADDGTAFVCNHDSYTIQKFDPSGRLVKTFGEQGPGDGQFRNRPTVHGVLDNRYIFTSEHNGRLTFFDLNGQFVKVLELDYMPQQCLPLRDGKIAVVGFVAWSEGRQRHIVAIEDINDGEENIVCSEITDSNAYGSVNLTTDKGRVSFVGSSSRPSGWVVARTSDGDLIASFTDTPVVEMFSPDGQHLGQFSMAIDRIKYSDKERGQYGSSCRISSPSSACLNRNCRRPWTASNTRSSSRTLTACWSIMSAICWRSSTPTKRTVIGSRPIGCRRQVN